ncbi:MAG TPA: hypothetical protein VK731_06480 [Candidatus Cybelea sp.]|nr:hypothetical protein [Candidatus Cybelea sp.]
MTHPTFNVEEPGDRARFVRARLPEAGLFTGQNWRVSPDPFPLGVELAEELRGLGRLLLQFNRSVNLLYRQSLAGKQPRWVAEWLDRGKPASVLETQRSDAFKNDLPRVIRPDIILTETGPCITELDSVPGGIGVTAWLNQTYAAMQNGEANVIGGAETMLQGFAGIFEGAPMVHIVVSEEAQTYRPEMEWLAGQLGARFQIRDGRFTDFKDGEAVYRFFELFDLPNIPSAGAILEMARARRIQLTGPPKPIFEEKMLFALLWNRNLRGFWRQELGERFLSQLQRLSPYTWMIDPSPLPPQGAMPGLDLTDWQQLKGLSQRERELILKVSGYSDKAWGARGVFLGSDLPTGEWAAAVDLAIGSFDTSPHVLQRYLKPSLSKARWFDFEKGQLTDMPGRVRLCPYYFVHGQGDAARANLSGVLATICPADKKIIHGMSTAILAPCSI